MESRIGQALNSLGMAVILVACHGGRSQGAPHMSLPTTAPGARAYVIKLLHVHDPVLRIDQDFLADAHVTRQGHHTIITSDLNVTVFSDKAQILWGGFQYIMVRPGERLPSVIIEHPKVVQLVHLGGGAR